MYVGDFKMIRKIQIWMWGIVAELEYQLYPWKTSEPPQWAVERYNVDHKIVDEFEEHMYYGWLKNHDDRIAKLQLEMIAIQKQLKNQ